MLVEVLVRLLLLTLLGDFLMAYRFGTRDHAIPEVEQHTEGLFVP